MGRPTEFLLSFSFLFFFFLWKVCQTVNSGLCYSLRTGLGVDVLATWNVLSGSACRALCSIIILLQDWNLSLNSPRLPVSYSAFVRCHRSNGQWWRAEQSRVGAVRIGKSLRNGKSRKCWRVLIIVNLDANSNDLSSDRDDLPVASACATFVRP